MDYEREWELIRILQDAYLSNDFTLIEPYLADDCAYHAYWNFDDAKSKEEVIALFRKKAEDVIAIGSCRLCRLGRTIPLGWQNGPYQSYYPEDQPIIIGYDEDETVVQTLIFIDLNQDGLIRSISANLTDLFRWEVVEEDRFSLQELYLKAFDFAAAAMKNEGYLEIHRGKHKMRFPNMVFLKEGLPIEAALRVSAYPFKGSLHPKYMENMQENMSLQRERFLINVQFKNLSDPHRPWSMDKNARLEADVTLTSITNELD